MPDDQVQPRNPLYPRSPFSAGSIAHDLGRKLEESWGTGGAVTGLPTGYARLDELTGGLQRQQLAAVLGPHSSGTTGFLLNLLRHLAFQRRVPVGLFSLDMSREYAVERLLCVEAQVSWQALRLGNLSEEEHGRLLKASFESIREVPLFIADCQEGTSFHDLCNRAKETTWEHCLGVLVFDRMSLMHDLGESPARDILIARRLKDLAREVGAPVVLCEALDIGRISPQEGLLRVADVVLVLEHPACETDQPVGRRTIRVTVSRNRNGPPGGFELAFDPNSLRLLTSE